MPNMPYIPLMNGLDKKGIALLLVRIAFGFRLIYGTYDNIISWERMLEFEQFLQANGFPFPLVCAIVSVYLQFIAGLSWILGFKVRLMSLLMIFNFLVAIIAVHLVHQDTYLNTSAAIHLVVIAILLYLIGPGKYALGKSEAHIL